MAKPVDPRLWRYARSARRYLGVSVLLSLVITGCTVEQIPAPIGLPLSRTSA
ncbi:hypothetical protein [Nocardia terpenica]|uniref:Uncharacterized protein n=1 Tax=Nocardia terpenica TaxID=455432 RepID=A0A6G9YVX1_9NOCA|nr:hypothetical protein [Nocardia terpenica]QIS17485.1 hypothetical protein F6W96_03365 [Nocardia terpenica]